MPQGESAEERLRFLDDLSKRKAGSIDKVKWYAAKSQVLLAGGTTLVELEDGHIVCLRRAPDPAAELIGNHVSGILGLRVPRLRLVNPGTIEYEEIKAMDQRAPTYVLDTPLTFEAFVEEIREAHAGQIPAVVGEPIVEQLAYTSPTRVEKTFGTRHKPEGTIAVMEFIPGTGLDRSCGKIAEAEMSALGLVGCAAAMLNFPEQICLPLWTEESGNLTNVMRTASRVGWVGYELVTIDTRVCVADSKSCQGFLHRLTAIVTLVTPKNKLDAVAKDPDLVIDPDITLDKIESPNRELFEQGGYEVTKDHIDCLLEGFREGFHKIGRLFNQGALQLTVRNAVLACEGIVPFDKGPYSPDECEAFVLQAGEAIKTVTHPDTVKHEKHIQKQEGDDSVREAGRCKTCSVL